MSSNRSIDGLQRRGDKKVVAHTVKRTTVKPQTKKVLVRKKAEAKKVESKEDKAVKEFFAEVKDVDPTDLVEVAPKERAKNWDKKPKEKKKHSKGKIVRRILLILLVIIVGGGVAAYIYFNDFVNKVTDDGNVLGLIFSNPDIPLEKDSMGRTNILVFGTEGYDMNDPNYDGGYLTDSMLVISFDQETGDAKAVSLPRDLKSKTCTTTSKINEVFWCQYSKTDNTAENNKKYEEAGGKDLEAAFEEVLGIDVQYRVHLNWQALIQVIDSIGGIDVVFTYGDQTWDGDETIIPTTDKRGLADGKGRKYYYQYPNGEVVHLDGASALAVARTRNAYGGYGAAGGNFSREMFQQKIIEAATKKAKSINLDLSTALGIKEAIGDNIRTNFKDTEIKTLIKLANTVDFKNIETISLSSPSDGTSPLMTTAMINGISYVIPSAGAGNYTKIHQYIKKKLSNSFEAEGAEIAVLNGTSAYGIAASEKKTLEEAGFTVISTNNAPSDQSGFDGVKIYQRTSSMTKTSSELQKRYNVNIKTEIPESLKNTKGDFIIIIGNGYSSADKKD